MQKTLTERVLQALAFEVIGILLCTPLFAWLMDTSWLEMGVVTVVNCFMALAWNVLFNATFEHGLVLFGMGKNIRTRTVHALLFETGLLVMTVPFAAWWLNISLTAALILDIGQLLFFLPYTYLYHWAFDSARAAYFAGNADSSK